LAYYYYGSTLVSAASFPMKLLAEINNNNNSIQYTGKVNVSTLHDNSTLMRNASATTPQEIHKPLTPKGSQEIQKKKKKY